MSLTIAGKSLGPIGFGLMSLTNPAKALPFDDAIAVMKAALNGGANFWNGALFYGPPDKNSLHLLNAYFIKYPEDRDKVVISIKVGFDWKTRQPMVDAHSMKLYIKESLKVADGKYWIDIFQAGRLD